MNKYISLIESKAIREHLNERKYIPSTFEAVYIVDKNRKLTLNEKFKLWYEIIDTMPDEKIEKEFKIGTLTLHEYLKIYIEIQKKLYNQFLEQEQNVVYTCSSGVVINTPNRKPIIKEPFYWCNIYTDINMCIQDAQEKKYPLFDVKKHYIKTKSEDIDYRCIWADLAPNGEIVDIGELFILGNDAEELHQFLKKATVSIPLPFKEGDLIYSKCWDCELTEFKSYKNGYIYAKGADKGECFCINNDLDIEFVDKSLCKRILEEAIQLCDHTVVDFIIKKKVLREEEISKFSKS